MYRDNPKRKLNMDILVVVIIAGLILILVNFMDSKLDELIVSDAEVLFTDINHDPSDEMHAELAEKIAEFRPDVYKMIELYDGELNEIMTVKFNETDGTEVNTNIKDYPELTSLILNYPDGHTSRTIDDTVEYIYFKWSYDDENVPYLFIIYTYKPLVKYVWMLKLICYSILFLTCFLLMRLSLKSKSEKIKYYNSLDGMGSPYC